MVTPARVDSLVGSAGNEKAWNDAIAGARDMGACIYHDWIERERELAVG